MLDVGCASGHFLQEARQAGWSIAGVEPSETPHAKARETLGTNAELYCSTLEHANLEPASFDALTLWDVLEHCCPDPKAGFMKLCGSLLKPGGKLLLNVPDPDSFEARLLGRRWPLLLAEHLNYFNRKSLPNLRRNGWPQVDSFRKASCVVLARLHIVPPVAASHPGYRPRTGERIGPRLRQVVNTDLSWGDIWCLVALNPRVRHPGHISSEGSSGRV